jgi:hypothetical protein
VLGGPGEDETVHVLLLEIGLALVGLSLDPSRLVVLRAERVLSHVCLLMCAADAARLHLPWDGGHHGPAGETWLPR